MNKQNKLAVMPVRRLLYTMSGPLALSLLVQSLYNIVDSIFVARLSEEALTATSLAYAVQMLMIALSVGTAVGLNALLSRRIGAGQVEAACRAATTGLWLTLISALIFVVGGLFSSTIAEWMTDDATLRTLCADYLTIVMLGCWGLFLQTYAQRLLQAVGDTVLSMVSLLIGAGVNIVLNPLLIFGYFGLPALGIRGSALATVIGQTLGALAAILFNRRCNPLIHVRLRGYRFVWKDVAAIYRVGLPTIVTQAIGSIMTFVVNALLIVVSPTAVAFFGVYYKLQNFLMMPLNGLGQAAIPIVGYNYGSGDHARIHATWRVLIPSSVGLALIGTTLFLLLPEQLLLLFSADAEMLALGVAALRIIAVPLVPAAVTMLCSYFASGFGNGVVNMFGSALRQLIVLVPAMTLLLKYTGLSSVWFAFWLAEGAAFVYSLSALRRMLRRLE